MSDGVITAAAAGAASVAAAVAAVAAAADADCCCRHCSRPTKYMEYGRCDKDDTLRHTQTHKTVNIIPSIPVGSRPGSGPPVAAWPPPVAQQHNSSCERC